MDLHEIDQLRVLLWEHIPGPFTVIPQGDRRTIASGKRPSLLKRARLIRLGQDRWSLGLADPRGRWAKAPVATGSMVDLVIALASHLADTSNLQPGPGSPPRLPGSGTSHET